MYVFLINIVEVEILESISPIFYFFWPPHSFYLLPFPTFSVLTAPLVLSSPFFYFFWPPHSFYFLPSSTFFWPPHSFYFLPFSTFSDQWCFQTKYSLVSMFPACNEKSKKAFNNLIVSWAMNPTWSMCFSFCFFLLLSHR